MKKVLVTELTRLMVMPEYVIPQQTVDDLSDHYGVLRGWDHETDEYTESQFDWLWFIAENYAS